MYSSSRTYLLFAIVALVATLSVVASNGCHHSDLITTSPSDSSKNPVDTTHRLHSIDDSVAYSFVVMGCNRLDKGDVNLSTNPSTANLAQLDRTFTDIYNLSPRPDYVILVGDLIIGKVTDSAQVGAQLRGWRAHYEASPLASTGIKLVLVPGNHEFNDGTSSANCEQAWLNNLSPYIVGSNGPLPGGADALATDQSRLSYSFDFHDAHFVLLNSDPLNASATIPATWVGQDMATARAAGSKHIFVFAHKPAYSFDNSISNGLTQASRDALWSAMSTNHAEAMFAAHNHIYKRQHPNNTSYMIIAGNGGSSLENPVGADNNFGFTRVCVLTSGHVVSRAYGRDSGPKYNDPSPAATYPTTVRDSVDITWAP